ncbi:MAG: hypothetical protein ACTSV7_01955 [Candidatus Baldrarchaeia archaeon]
MTRLIYCATPSRLVKDKEKIMDFVKNEGCAPLHPFCALPYDYFEGGKVGRQKTLEYCLRLIDISDEFWLFGVSDGTLIEFYYCYKNGKPIRNYLKEFDPCWKKYYQKIKDKQPREIIEAFHNFLNAR